MSIDPKTAQWLNVIYLILTGLSLPVLTAAGIPHPEQIMADAALLSLPLNVLLHGISSDKAGPFTK